MEPKLSPDEPAPGSANGMLGAADGMLGSLKLGIVPIVALICSLLVAKLVMKIGYEDFKISMDC
jgi:hypothetical protein